QAEGEPCPQRADCRTRTAATTFGALVPGGRATPAQRAASTRALEAGDPRGNRTPPRRRPSRPGRAPGVRTPTALGADTRGRQTPLPRPTDSCTPRRPHPPPGSPHENGTPGRLR